MADDDFFGYPVAPLRQASTSPASLPPELLKESTDESWYSDRRNVTYQDVPDPDESGRDIEYVNMQIMGEQPATAEYRAQEWAKLGNLLSSVQSQLRDQTKELAETWDSPSAKEIFLDKVGMTLAYLDVWHEAATTNSFALMMLAQVMNEAQDEMRELYAEYQEAMARSATEESLARTVGVANNGVDLDKIANAHEPGPPSSQGSGKYHAQWAETMRTRDQNKKNYDRFARELASRLAERYVPVIHRLESGRARKMTPLNAVNHPGAYGNPMETGAPPPPPGAPPGGPGGGPGAPPGGPPAPPPNPDGLKDKPEGLKDKPDGLGDKPDALKDKPDVPDAPPPAPDPQSLTAPPPPPVAPVLPPPPPVAPVPGQNLAPRTPNPNLSPRTVTALTNAMNQLGLTGLNTTTFTASQTAQFSATASLQNGMYPPGTIPPPPGGIPTQPKQQGKVLGQRPGMTPPPGAQTRGAPEPGHQQKTAPGTEVPQAFQPPPPTSAPVLDNRQRKRTRPGGAKEAPTATGQTTTPGVTPPVLANPHRGTAPKRTYTEERAERRRAREQQRKAEIATGVSTGTASVLGGRFDPRPEVRDEAPITLRGREVVAAAADPHARPEVHADRATRGQQAVPAAEQTAWEVETPGGPVVASGAEEKKYRPEPPNALGAR